MVSASDRTILRKLAGRVAELAARLFEDEKRELWYRHNALEPTRPLVFCSPENGWSEIISPDKLECEGELARGWEMGLRQQIFACSEMNDDRVTEPSFGIGYVYTQSDWGLQETYTRGENSGSFVWDAPMKTYDDLEKLRFPEIVVDYDATDRMREIAESVFCDFLKVKVSSPWYWSLGITSQFIKLRGLEQMLYDMIDTPEGMHRLMAFLHDGHLAMLDYLQSNKLLSLNNDGSYVGSGGFGWSHELPQPDFNGTARTCDMWGFCESQETIGVSPDIFEEFVFQYQLPILERFGLNCYGCCEPIDRRWDVVKKTPRLRRVSISAWCDLKRSADMLEDKYIFSWKPNPADLAAPTFDADRIRREMRESLEITKGCRVEIIMKDNHTIGNDPQRVIDWVRIAKEEAERI